MIDSVYNSYLQKSSSELINLDIYHFLSVWQAVCFSMLNCVLNLLLTSTLHLSVILSNHSKSLFLERVEFRDCYSIEYVTNQLLLIIITPLHLYQILYIIYFKIKLITISNLEFEARKSYQNCWYVGFSFKMKLLSVVLLSLMFSRMIWNNNWTYQAIQWLLYKTQSLLNIEH